MTQILDPPKSSSPPGSSGVLLSIQAMRGLAVLAVILVHVQLYFAAQLGMPDFIPYFNIGAASVDLFFVISGFIMVYASERLFGRPGATRTFFLRRVARIVPLYWATTTIILLYLLLRHRDFDAGGSFVQWVLSSYAFLPFPRGDGTVSPIHGVGWTLNYEMFFYALFGIFVFLSRRGVVIAIGSLFCTLIVIGFLFGPLPEPFGFWTSPIIIEFVFGMIIALAYRDGVRLPRWLVRTLVLAGVAVYAWSATKGHFFGPPPESAIRVLLWGVPAIGIIGGLALAEQRPAANAFWRLFGFLGDASYSLYLVHPMALGLPRMILGRWIEPASAPWFYVFCMLACAIVLPLLVYVFIEKPTTEALQKKIEARPRAPIREMATG
jgi:exopolysaccharide production protein ExoZ